MNVTSADIKRGLGNMAFKPLKLQHSLETAETGSGGSGTTPATTDSRVDASVERRVDPPVNQSVDQRAINIPMNFEFNSTRLDQSTAKNIDVLASTLAEVDFAGKQFVFVGHADQRGSAEANMVLSTQRALAIYEAVVALQPSLAGRISTQGRGAEQPLSLGTTDADYRVNRRLEVILR
jgi:outer membrane protein OmpA-like peptidoglycan-associated protein